MPQSLSNFFVEFLCRASFVIPHSGLQKQKIRVNPCFCEANPCHPCAMTLFVKLQLKQEPIQNPYNLRHFSPTLEFLM